MRSLRPTHLVTSCILESVLFTWPRQNLDPLDRPTPKWPVRTSILDPSKRCRCHSKRSAMLMTSNDKRKAPGINEQKGYLWQSGNCIRNSIGCWAVRICSDHVGSLGLARVAWPVLPAWCSVSHGSPVASSGAGFARDLEGKGSRLRRTLSYGVVQWFSLFEHSTAKINEAYINLGQSTYAVRPKNNRAAIQHSPTQGAFLPPASGRPQPPSTRWARWPKN